MAAAIPKFDVAIFADPHALKLFVNNGSSVVASIVDIVCDSSGKYILFYIHT
jgi:hypothetical protein